MPSVFWGSHWPFEDCRFGPYASLSFCLARVSAHTEYRKLAAIMFTDMVGYSALAQRNEALALELLEEHRALLRPIFPKFNGREVETAGDAFLVEFASALEATRCAVEIQRTLSERNQAQPLERRILLRIGIHVGDVVHKDGKVMGDAVNIAARLEPLAPAGGICVSNAVFEQVRNKLEQAFASLGPAELKNIELPMAVHRVVMPWEASGRTSLPTSPSRRRAAALRLALLLLVPALAAAVILWKPWHTPGPGVAATNATERVAQNPMLAGAAPNPDSKSVAVLAFANLSEDKSNEYFSDGVSEELLNVLAKIPGLKVSARTSAFHFKGKDTPIAEIARQLGVAYVVEGSVRRSDNRVRITAQLIKAADGFHVWSDTFTREVKDVFAVQDEIAGLIARNLSLKMGVTTTGPASVDPEVSRLYFEARQLWSVRSDQALAQMEALLTRALEIDPRFAPAEAGLAQVSVVRSFVRVAAARHLEVELASVSRHATKAIELDPTSAEAFEALGTAALVRGELADAETALTRAVALNPNYAPGWNKWGWLLLRRGVVDQALEKFAKAKDLDPLVWPMVDGNAIALLQNRRYADAMQMFAQSRALPVCAPVSWANGGIALLLGGRNNEALATVRVVTQGSVKGDWNRGLWDWSDGLSAWVLAETGAREEAKVIVERLLAGPEAQRFGAGFGLVALGREDEGFAALRAVPQQLVMYLWLLVQRHETLATDPRFEQLLAGLDATEGFRKARASLAQSAQEGKGR
jgi:adenylate cyclase